MIGLMSGTSLDGVDACCVDIHWQENAPLETVHCEIVATHSVDMPTDLKTRLLALQSRDPQPSVDTVASVCQLNMDVARLFAQAVNELLTQNPSLLGTIDAVASHGQTIWHQPPNTLALTPSTLQIGDSSTIAELTGITTVGNFRPRDMAVGGQGAPLVPLADQLLFQAEDKTRCVHNLGGISNVTVLPAKTSGKAITAFDTGPANMLIDVAMQRWFQRPCDKDGAIAASGAVNQSLLTRMLADPFFAMVPPKSTGRERFGDSFFNTYKADLQALAPENIVATLTQLTVDSIVAAYRQFVTTSVTVDEIILGGGGTYNCYLMSQLATGLQALSPTIQVTTHADYHIPNQYKEALAFALLGWATLLNLPGNVPSCTGAHRAVVLGQISAGKTFNF